MFCYGLQQFLENSNVGVCLNELQCMEFGEVRAQMKLRATQALIIAVEHATDAVEISNENHEIQVRLETVTNFRKQQ